MRPDLRMWAELHKTQTSLLDATAEIERLRETVRQRTKLLDDQLGTPCEQIRHEQEIERLRALVEKCAQIADGYRCGVCGMDGKAGAEIRALTGRDDLP